MAVSMKGLRLKPKYEDLIGVAVSDKLYNIKFPNRDATFLRNGFVLSQLDGEGMRQMQIQQEQASKEAFKESLLKQIAVNTGANLSDLRTNSNSETQTERVTQMLNSRGVNTEEQQRATSSTATSTDQQPRTDSSTNTNQQPRTDSSTNTNQQPRTDSSTNTGNTHFVNICNNRVDLTAATATYDATVEHLTQLAAYDKQREEIRLSEDHPTGNS